MPQFLHKAKTNLKVIPIDTSAPPKEFFPHLNIKAFFELVVNSSSE
jgi:hypothetical protein